LICHSYFIYLIWYIVLYLYLLYSLLCYSHPLLFLSFFFFNDTATTEIYTLSLHDALPISLRGACGRASVTGPRWRRQGWREVMRSEEHTSELQSLAYLVCRLLLEKKKKKKKENSIT